MVANQPPGVLDDHPVLLRALPAFFDDYGLADQPGIVWQARPATAQRIDVADEKIGAALRAGVPATDGWSAGFASQERPSLIFDGLGSVRDPKDRGWTAELHEDGHIIVGLWRFPEKDGAGVKPYLFPWHAQMFEQFGQLATALLAAAAIDTAVVLTATMMNATAFGLALEENRMPMTLRPISRATLQWPVEQAASRGEIKAAAVRLAGRFLRLFGRLQP